MKLLDTAWVLAIGIDLGALMVFLFNKYTPTMSTFLIWAVLIMISAILILCSIQERMMKMQPRKKRLPVRRGSLLVATSRRGNLKVVGK